MGLFKRRAARRAPRVAEPPPPTSSRACSRRSQRLTEANRAGPRPRDERRLLRLRHLAGVRLTRERRGAPEYPAPDYAAPAQRRRPARRSRPAELTPGLLRAGILRDGCVLVRGLVDREAALALAAQIDRAFAARAALEAGSRPAPRATTRSSSPRRASRSPPCGRGSSDGGGVLAATRRWLAYEMLELFASAGLTAARRRLPRRAAAAVGAQDHAAQGGAGAVGGAWHQDGAFMGDVRALNLWLSLSRCGDEAPGLDIVPRRRRRGRDRPRRDARRRADAREGRGGGGRHADPAADLRARRRAVLRRAVPAPDRVGPVAMPKPRFAIESWFFGGSAFPADYAPLAV